MIDGNSGVCPKLGFQTEKREFLRVDIKTAFALVPKLHLGTQLESKLSLESMQN